MRRLAAMALLVSLAAGIVGCGSDKEPEGYTKEAFTKRPAPPGYGPPQGAPATPK